VHVEDKTNDGRRDARHRTGTQEQVASYACVCVVVASQTGFNTNLVFFTFTHCL